MGDFGYLRTSGHGKWHFLEHESLKAFGRVLGFILDCVHRWQPA